MKIYNRYLNLIEEAKFKSIFLFGPRQTGKTFLLKKLFPKSKYYNLLMADQFLYLSRRPSLIREEILSDKLIITEPIIIDEIQKLPILLDEVHCCIEEFGARFILTGSSARALKRKGVNLLGGRARTRTLFPLVSAEIDDFELLRVINFGSLPSVYLSKDPEEDLIAYCGTYLKEEIQSEGLVRGIENFSRFLQIAALANGELLNFESVASDAGIPARTVREYFKILEDTLIGYLLEPYSKKVKRKPVSTSKFYFFDIGVRNILANVSEIKLKSDEFGRALEHLLFMEITAYLSYARDRRKLTFWRTNTGIEVDFVIGDDTAIEVKASDFVSEKHCKGIRAMGEEFHLKNMIIVSMDKTPRMIGNIKVIPVENFLKKLWDGEF